MPELRQTVHLNSPLSLDSCIRNLKRAVIEEGMWRSIRLRTDHRILIGQVVSSTARVRLRRWVSDRGQSASARVVLSGSPSGTSAVVTTEPELQWWFGLLVGPFIAIAGTAGFRDSGAPYPMALAPAALGLAFGVCVFGWFFVERRMLVEAIRSTLEARPAPVKQ